MSYQSKYNVFDEHGQVVYVAGAEIDEAEAVRQGIAALPTGKQLVFTDGVAVLEDAPAEDRKPAPRGDQK